MPLSRPAISWQFRGIFFGQSEIPMFHNSRTTEVRIPMVTLWFRAGEVCGSWSYNPTSELDLALPNKNTMKFTLQFAMSQVTLKHCKLFRVFFSI